ncbi:MAG TPA: DNA adenine methylase [Gemmatimonadaceae bacterium]|nr:DNA adenine methylase [Gemmatimonadaceae bacterium]
MRYIGNKTKLLPFIGDVLAETGITAGRALDAFAGTCAVGRYLKSLGFGVATCDLMTYSYVLQRAYVVARGYPAFAGLCEDLAFQRTRAHGAFTARVEARRTARRNGSGDGHAATRPLAEVLVYLDTELPPRASFMTEHFSASPEIRDGERSYFSRENAMQIDAIRHRIEEWSAEGLIDEDEYFVLLAALIEAADAVANTTGIYAAFVKSWQPNARRALTLALPQLTAGSGEPCDAHRGNINELIDQLGHVDLLYLDPPYNTRQYSSYYHVPELIARGWFASVPELRGKTGLIADAHLKSAWSTREGCVRALADLIARADADHVLMSYNSEGLIPETEIEAIFRAHGIGDTYRRTAREYARYRSDSDSASRRYKADSVMEYLYYVQMR